MPDGRLKWNPRGLKTWDARFAGKFVAENLNAKGYRKVAVGRRNVLQHRVIWKMHHGTDPEIVDHINGLTSDNRIENLRAACHFRNQFNAKSRCGNSRFRGVYLSRGGRWSARVRAHGKTWHLGTYDTEEDAALAYDEEAVRLHKDFARTNKMMFGI